MVKKAKKRMTVKTKVIISSLSTICVIGIGAYLFHMQQNSNHSSTADKYYKVQNVKEGSTSSTTLLSGTVKALNEMYVYYDSSKGTQATPTVKVGDQVTAGQQLVQYNTTTAQAAYDSANRKLNKIGRQINYLKTYGVPLPASETESGSSDSSQQDSSVQPTTQQTTQQGSNYNQQLQDLNDLYADAQSEVTKAKSALDDTVISSTVNGTVVEVNKDIDPSSKNSQTIVHVVSEGQLQVKGNMTEYDLANIKVGQDVKIKSKVYPDKEWTGKMAYISNYPKDNANSPSSDSNDNTNNGAAYEYKSDITSPLNELKQGFSVSVEVVNPNKYPLIPLKALVSEGKKHYVWTYNDSTAKVSKKEVGLANSDASNQEISKGLKVGEIVITNPTKSLKNGQKIENIKSTDTSKTSQGKMKSEVKK